MMANRSGEDSFLNSNLMKRCDIFLKNNNDKFHKYAEHQETFRLQLITTNDEYKNIQTWLDSTYVNIISLKSEQGELLLENNCVLEFLHILNDLDAQRLKFVETINEYKILKRTVDIVNKDIVSLKSEYNDLKRSYKKVPKKDLANKILNDVEKRKKILFNFKDANNSCERLNCSLDIASERIRILNEKHDNLLERYRVLSENKIVKEFLEYAKRQAKVRLKSPEISNNSECSESLRNRANEDTTSLKSELTETLKMLNSERLKREVVENERNTLDKLSERLCRLLFKYQNHESLDEINEESAMINESNKKPANEENVSSDRLDNTVDSTSSSVSKISSSKSEDNLDEYKVSCFKEENNMPADIVKLEKTDSVDESKAVNSSNNLNENYEKLVVIKEETANAFPITFADTVPESPKFSPSNSKDENVSKNNCDTTTLSSKAKEKKNTPNCRKSSKRKKKSQKSQSRIKAMKLPKKINLSNRIVENQNQIESFSCDKCGKSFIVKPNERKPQNCPICDILHSYRVPKLISVSTADTSATSHQIVPSTVFNNLSKQHKVLNPCCDICD